MQSFKQFLTELFDNPYNWSWSQTSSNKAIAKFTTEQGTKIQVQFSKTPDDETEWELFFGVDDGTYVVNTEIDLEEFDTAKIMATVIDITNTFILKFEPESLIFSGEKSISGPDRGTFYKNVLRKISKDIPSDYEVKTKDLSMLVDFEIVKKD